MQVALENSEVEVPTALAKIVEQKAGGNPFFVKEVTRTMREKDIIVLDSESGEVKFKKAEAEKAVSGMTLTRIENALAARIDNLHTDGINLTKLASVVGDTFHQKLVRGLSERANLPIHGGGVEKRIRELFTLGFFVDKNDGSALATQHQGAGVFGFRSQLVREVVYQPHVRAAKAAARGGEGAEARGGGGRAPQGRRAKPHLEIWAHLKAAEDQTTSSSPRHEGGARRPQRLRIRARCGHHHSRALVGNDGRGDYAELDDDLVSRKERGVAADARAGAPRGGA